MLLLDAIKWRIALLKNKLQGIEPYLTWLEYLNLITSDNRCLPKRNLVVKDVKESGDGFYKIDLIEGSIYWPCEFNLDDVLDEIVLTSLPGQPHNYFQWGSIRPGDVILDIGACEGSFSLKCLSLAKEIHLIEPIPRAVESLQKTFEKHMKENLVFIHQIALSDTTGQAQFEFPKEAPQGGRLGRIWPTSENPEKITVHKETLDEFIRNLDIKKIDLIKMDVEGSELAILKGAVTVLSTHRPRLLICTYHHPRQYDDIVSYLSKFSYDITRSKLMLWDFDGQRTKCRPALIFAEPK